MSLRLKLLIPLLLIAGLVGAYFYNVWLPRALVEAQSDHLERVQRHLDSVAESLIPLLVSGQLAAIHENLSALKQRNQDWQDIRLIDPRGRQLYPLIGGAPPPGDAVGKQVVERPIRFFDSELGSLNVLIDFSDLHRRDREHHGEMGMILGLVTLILLLTLGVALELTVARPVHTLVRASRELARGNYGAALPPKRNDEVGALITAFAAMRADLREHHDNLLQEIDARDRAQQEQVRLNAALADRESDLRAVTDAVQDAIIRVDEQGRISFWNPGAERLFGLDATQAVGTPMHEVLTPARYRERARNEYAIFAQSGNGAILGQTIEIEALRADGQEFPVELTVSRLRTAKGWNAVGVVRDISERQRIAAELIQHRNHLEELVAQRTTELKEKNASLESALSLVQLAQQELIESEKLASLGRLVAGFAHEINTPIGVAVGASSVALDRSKELQPLLLQDEVDEAVLRNHLGAIDEACRLVFSNLTRAADLVGRFKRTSVDQARGAARLYELDETINDVIASLHDVLKRTTVTIRVSCPGQIKLYGYPGALGQILTNLVINSLHHAFANGTGTGEIALTGAREGDEVVITVSDNGRGMDAQTLSRIFEPFYTTARESGGTGLGLFICHNLATAELKGSLRCDSEPGRGTRFVLRYPTQSAPRAA